MRQGEWIQHLNVRVVRAEDRPDKPKGDVVYRLKDIFTTRDGSWDPRTGHLGSVSAWARDTYLRPWNAPDRFDDAGGDHHLFARVLDANGNHKTDQNLVQYWSDGLHSLADSGYNGYSFVTPKSHSGWANVVMSGGSNFVPERGESGPWCWCPRGAADVVVGGGMPAKHHISFFAVWQAEERGASSLGSDGQAEEESETSAQSDQMGEDVLRSVRMESWRQVGVDFNRDSSFASYARVHGLGAPLTNEFDVDNFRAQGFVGGIVFAPIGKWDDIEHAAW